MMGCLTVDSLDVHGCRYDIRRATESDVPALVSLLSDDLLGGQRESSDLEPYLLAFHEIDRDPNQLLLTVLDAGDTLVGTMQLTLIPGLARQGSKRLQVEAVRLASHARGRGLGTALFDWAHEYGRKQGASLAQLTSDKTRTGAHRFYEDLGYRASHEGFKRPL
jgi:GNAT superfamily N-acetyltransferase